MGELITLPVRRHDEPQESSPPRAVEPASSPATRSRPGARPGTRPGARPGTRRGAGAEPGPDVEPLWRESVGRELRRERLASGRRLVDVAEEAGVSPQYLSEVERGLKDPSSELLAAMAGALGLSVGTLATRVGSTGVGSTAPQSPVCLAA